MKLLTFELQNGTNELIDKTEIESQMSKIKLKVTRRREEGRINYGIRIDMYSYCI